MINPPDALVAARSFPRRWRTLYAEAEDGTDLSVADGLARQATAVMITTADRLGPAPDRPATGGSLLDGLEAAAHHLAEAIDRVPPSDWSGTRVEDLTAGIEQAAALLRRAEAAIEEARADRAG